jgi:hypothetical protein
LPTESPLIFGGGMRNNQTVKSAPSGSRATKFIVVLLSFLVCTSVVAHDDGQFTNASPAVRAWFHNVKSPSGIPCCDIADGHRMEFQMRKKRYWVPINGTWMPVPPEAVLSNVGNPVGDAIVWYSAYGNQVVIRCFVPGGGA